MFSWFSHFLTLTKAALNQHQGERGLSCDSNIPNLNLNTCTAHKIFTTISRPWKSIYIIMKHWKDRDCLQVHLLTSPCWFIRFTFLQRCFRTRPCSSCELVTMTTSALLKKKIEFMPTKQQFGVNQCTVYFLSMFNGVHADTVI